MTYRDTETGDPPGMLAYGSLAAIILSRLIPVLAVALLLIAIAIPVALILSGTIGFYVDGCRVLWGYAFEWGGRWWNDSSAWRVC